MVSQHPYMRLRTVFRATAEEAEAALEEMKQRFERDRKTWINTSPKRRMRTRRFQERMIAAQKAIEAARRAAAEF